MSGVLAPGDRPPRGACVRAGNRRVSRGGACAGGRSDPHDVIAKYGLNEQGACGADYIEKGVDLSTYFGRPLPGCPPGYFEGKAPDCGASALKVNKGE